MTNRRHHDWHHATTSFNGMDETARHLEAALDVIELLSAQRGLATRELRAIDEEESRQHLIEQGKYEERFSVGTYGSPRRDRDQVVVADDHMQVESLAVAHHSADDTVKASDVSSGKPGRQMRIGHEIFERGLASDPNVDFFTDFVSRTQHESSGTGSKQFGDLKVGVVPKLDSDVTSDQVPAILTHNSPSPSVGDHGISSVPDMEQQVPLDPDYFSYAEQPVADFPVVGDNSVGVPAEATAAVGERPGEAIPPQPRPDVNAVNATARLLQSALFEAENAELAVIRAKATLDRVTSDDPAYERVRWVEPGLTRAKGVVSGVIEALHNLGVK